MLDSSDLIQPAHINTVKGMKILFGIPIKVHAEISTAEVLAFKKLGVEVETSFYGNSNKVRNYLPRLLLIFKNAINLKKKSIKQKSDIVYLNSSFDYKTLVRDSITLFILRMRNKKIIVILKTHGTVKETIFSKNILRNYLFKNIDLFLVLSKEEVDDLKSAGLSENKICITANPLDIKAYHPDPCFKKRKEIKEETIVLLFVGRFIKEKGIIDLIEACKLIKERGLEFKLLCLGSGPLFVEVDRLITDFDLKNEVTLIGHIPEDETTYYYSNCDILISPSYREGFPMAIFQAVAAGKPIITTEVNACADYLKEYENCLWIKINNPEDIAIKIKALSEDLRLREKMKMKNLLLARQFTAAKIVCNLHSNLLELLKRKKPEGSEPKKPNTQSDYKVVTNTTVDKQKNKILILVPDLNLPGGVTNYYKTLNLDTAPNISYFFVNKDKIQSHPEVLVRLFFIYLKFFYTLLTGDYQIIHLNPSLDYRSFFRDSLFVLISKLFRKKTLVFFRGWQENYEKKIKANRFKRFLFKISYSKADKYIVLSSVFQRKLIEMGVSSQSTFFVETTVADTRYLSEFNLKKKFVTYNEKINFLFLSRILVSKGVYIAINSFREFSKKFPDKSASLIIAGDGPDLAEVKRYVTAEKIGNVVFTGYISHERKKKVLFESHILLFPSYSEGMPNVILEAMLHGMPVISRATGAIPDIVRNDINGFLTESYDCSDFSAFIEKLAFDQEKYQEISRNNNKIAINKFTQNTVRKRIMQIYETF